MGLLSFLSILSFSACGAGASQSSSQYEASINIPKYNANDSAHVLITENNGNWNEDVLNDLTKQHFYIKPGKYHKTVANKTYAINIRSSGTEDKRRTLSLHNGNDTHPAALPDNQVADVLFYFVAGANYWTIDRMANLDRNLNPSLRFIDGASHNIVNRWHLRNFKYGVTVRPSCNYNTVQNSYLNQMTHEGRMKDNVAMAIHDARTTGSRIVGTKFINNDIRNSNDGVQLVVGGSATDVQYPDTIIDSNHIWVDKNIYTNGDYATNGYNPKGKYMIAENAIGLKTGSNDPTRPVIITNNIMWGYRKGDETADGSFSGSNHGVSFASQDNAANIKLHNNIFFDSVRAATIVGGLNWDVRHNIFTQINKVNPLDVKTYGVLVSVAKNVKVEENTFVDIQPRSSGAGYFFAYNESVNSPFSRNVAIDSTGTTSSFGNKADGNFFYNAPSVRLNGINDRVFSTSAEAKMEDYTFRYERFTAAPKQKTLKGVITTNKSPHYEKAGSKIANTTTAAASVYQNSRSFPEIIAFIIL